MPLLSVENVSKSFGGLDALQDVTFAVHQGQIKALIGPNGAGKTTLFNLVSGSYRPTEGRVLFGGRRRDRQGAPHASAAWVWAGRSSTAWCSTT